MYRRHAETKTRGPYKKRAKNDTPDKQSSGASTARRTRSCNTNPVVETETVDVDANNSGTVNEPVAEESDLSEVNDAETQPEEVEKESNEVAVEKDVQEV